MKLNNIANKRYAERATFSYADAKYTTGAPIQLFAGVVIFLP
mgnify:CR=1 FL=1